MTKLSHEVLLALAYVSQISDPDLIRLRFIESLNGLGTAFTFRFAERSPPGLPENVVFPITTLRSFFGYALMEEGPETTEAERSVFRTAFHFLAVLLENRMQARALQSRNESLLKEVNQEKSLVHAVLETLPVGVWVTDAHGKILMGNTAGETIWGGIRYVGMERYGEYKARWTVTGKRVEPEAWAVVRALATGETVIHQEPIRIECFDGTEKTILNSAAPILDDERKVLGAIVINQDITDLKRTEEALRQSEEQYRKVFEEHSAVKVLVDPETGNIIEANRAAVHFYGWPYERLKAMKNQEISTLSPEDIGREIEKILAGSQTRFEYRHRLADGSIRDVEVYSSKIEAKGRALIHSIIHDITDRKQAEQERTKLQEQLNQAQKMESVGRLAGGVAHDFNNMLGVILGHMEIAVEAVDPSQPIYSALREVQKAAERSVDLTRQLLAFARQQTISPRALDVNEIVGGMLKMLQRIIGEDIRLVWLPGIDLWPVKIDPSQIDQILVNLCVNARDAISGVGTLTIETGNASFDETYCSDHLGCIPGDYVLLVVSDDGCGMDKHVLSKIFEPFFTTKALGQGTGLGMATVYGIVKQNDGFLNVYSEPGTGTTFRIYLRRHAGKAEQRQKEDVRIPIAGGRETILVVEDEPALLDLARCILEQQGYEVLTAGTPREAIRIAEQFAREIHLLITDVVMPEMNGRDLTRNLLPLYPNLKSLFMSGYTANVIAHHGILDEGVHFIQKPFSRNDITGKVRVVLSET
jgi:PAS domain S-box-containing protein